ncbi:MAG: heme A synthase [Alphaproteobacteria bacterium]|nr:heme A synthase [Alphaproteobacteria bacterium]
MSVQFVPPPPRYRAIAIWLLLCCAMIFAMVVIGGITRLTESGLSMVEWRPLIGWLPPLTEAAWHEVFVKYQASPQFEKVNAGMSLDDFQTIFWWEYIHRLWGRLIGVVFLLPFLWFLVRGYLDRALAPKLVIMFVLGGLQGLLGWYMVKSGLVDRPEVSQYRLAAHLGLAVVIYGYMLWVALGLLTRPATSFGPSHRTAAVLPFLVFVTLVSGGFVAGLDAGLAYNTFPLMGDAVVPEAYFAMEPAIVNVFENIAAVQFNHRLLAIVTLAATLAYVCFAGIYGIEGRARALAAAIAIFACIQVGLGIATLLLFVPLPLAVAHQAGALVLFTLAVWLVVELRHGQPKSAF